MTAQQARPGGRYLHRQLPTQPTGAQMVPQGATAPLWEFLSVESKGALLAWMRSEGRA